MRAITLRCAALSMLLALAVSPVWGDSPPPHPRFETGQPLTAERLVAWVLDANPGLAAAAAAAEAAAYRIEPAGALDDPMLSYSVAPLTLDTERGLNQTLDVSQKIPWPGTLAAREAAARHDAATADRDLDVLRLRVIAQAKSAYAEWRFVQSALEIHYATQALLDELIATAQTRYAAGRALKQDVLQAELERNDLDNQELRLRQQQTTVRARINALLNRAPHAPLPEAAPIALLAEPPPAFEVLEARARAQHPELARLDARVSASQSRVTLAEKAFYPDFQVGVGYNGVWDETDKRPMIGVSINIPLDRGKRRSALNQARADRQRAEWSLIERRAELLANLAQARAEVTEAQSSVALYRDKLLPLASEYLSAAVADYQSGTGAFLNVITAEQRKLRSELALARTRADYARRLAELEQWTGGPLTTPRQTPAGVQE